MKDFKKLLEKRTKAKAALARVDAEIREARGRRAILCSCGKKHRIDTLQLRVTHWYVEPHGCSGGDYWNEGEWQFLCPQTGMLNRLMFDDWDVEYERRSTVGAAAEPTFKSLYRDLFASKVDVHERSDERSRVFHNNFYVDEHRKMFELPPKPEKKP